jgi:hypothetical protein
LSKSNSNQEGMKIAGRQYEVENYKRKDELSAGLATTHEQVSDVYAEGQINAVIEDVNGEDIRIPEK